MHSQEGQLGHPVSVLLGHAGPATFIDFSPAHADVLLSSSADGTCRLWAARQGGPAAHVLTASPAFGPPRNVTRMLGGVQPVLAPGATPGERHTRSTAGTGAWPSSSSAGAAAGPGPSGSQRQAAVVATQRMAAAAAGGSGEVAAVADADEDEGQAAPNNVSRQHVTAHIAWRLLGIFGSVLLWVKTFQGGCQSQ